MLTASASSVTPDPSWSRRTAGETRRKIASNGMATKANRTAVATPAPIPAHRSGRRKSAAPRALRRRPKLGVGQHRLGRLAQDVLDEILRVGAVLARRHGRDRVARHRL